MLPVDDWSFVVNEADAVVVAAVVVVVVVVVVVAWRGNHILCFHNYH